jgi:Helix-turn-helix domain
VVDIEDLIRAFDEIKARAAREPGALLTVEEFAATGLSKSTVLRAARNRKIVAVKLYGKWHITRKSLATILS